MYVFAFVFCFYSEVSFCVSRTSSRCCFLLGGNLLCTKVCVCGACSTEQHSVFGPGKSAGPVCPVNSKPVSKKKTFVPLYGDSMRRCAAGVGIGIDAPSNIQQYSRLLPSITCRFSLCSNPSRAPGGRGTPLKKNWSAYERFLLHERVRVREREREGTREGCRKKGSFLGEEGDCRCYCSIFGLGS